MKEFQYELEIMADPEEVFAALTVPFQIELWSGYPADMKAEVGYLITEAFILIKQYERRHQDESKCELLPHIEGGSSGLSNQRTSFHNQVT